jgi:hypothetical protein
MQDRIANLSLEDIERELKRREGAKSKQHNDRELSVGQRYQDAYDVARITTGAGSAIKGLGVVIGVLGVFGGFLSVEWWIVKKPHSFFQTE